MVALLTSIVFAAGCTSYPAATPAPTQHSATAAAVVPTVTAQVRVLATPTPIAGEAAKPTATPAPTKTAPPRPTITPTSTRASPPTPAVLRRLATGTLLQGSGENGLGELTIENGRNLDAVAVLTSLGNAPVESFYIQAGDSFTIKGIQDGIYYVFFSIGEDWDSGAAKFTRKAGFFRFEDLLVFETIAVSGGQEYTVFELTLHPVVGGMAETLPVEAGQFPDLR